MSMLLVSLLLALPLAAPASKRPNVLLIISDDQGWGDFGFMGSEEIQTPHLDALAEQGLVFPRGYVPTALCRASLMTLVTGLYPHQHKVTGNDPPSGVDRALMLDHIALVQTLPELLGAAGYSSLQTGKWWEGNCQCGGFSEGMTHGDPARGGRHGDEGLKIGRKGMGPALEFIDECAREGTPFFLWYAPFLPHRPHNPPERILQKYRGAEVPESIARYRAMCEWFDETCGELLGHLRLRGITEDTLVIFVTDNGWIQLPETSGYAPRSKRTPYEGGVRTPVILSWPGEIEPRREQVPISSVDIAPTILEACGLEVPETWPGLDLRTIAGQGASEVRPIFGAAFTHDVVAVDDPAQSLLTRWVLRDPFKLLVHTDPERPDELYDVREDPAEEQLLDDEPLASELRVELDGWWRGTSARPNFLVVVTDDQRFDQLGAAGHPVLQTPTMDRLAEGGVRFTNAFVTTPICAASRASLMTGRREGRHGYTFGTPPMGAELAADTYFARLSDVGYRTGFVGKWGVRFEKQAMEGLVDSFQPLSQPYIREGKPHLTDRVADRAISFLDDRERDQPFCLTVSFWAPHAEDGHADQYIPPTDLAGLYEDAEVPVPPLASSGFDVLPEFLQSSLGRRRWGWRFDTREKQIKRTRDYWRMITGVDRALGRILTALEERELAEDTVVLFMGDNGYFLGERGLAGKWLIYEESIRVPLIVYDPRAGQGQRGRVLDSMALNVDIAPTLLDLAGAQAPEAYGGRSLVPLLRGEQPTWRKDFLVEHLFDHAEIPTSVGVRGARWVYARYEQQEPPYEQLFDLENDPQELVNLAADPAFSEVLVEQRARCDELLAN